MMRGTVPWYYQLNETDISVLKQIGGSISSVSPYEIQQSIEKSYNVIHKSVKKLHSSNLIELQITTSEKSGKKTEYSLNFLGFCAYFSILASDIKQPSAVTECIKAIHTYADFHELLTLISSYLNSQVNQGLTHEITILLKIVNNSTDNISYINSGNLINEAITEYESQLGELGIFNLNYNTFEDLYLIFTIHIAETLYQGILNSEYSVEVLDKIHTIFNSNEIFTKIFQNYAICGVLSSIELVSGISKYTPEIIKSSLKSIDWESLTQKIRNGIEKT